MPPNDGTSPRNYPAAAFSDLNQRKGTHNLVKVLKSKEYLQSSSVSFVTQARLRVLSDSLPKSSPSDSSGVLSFGVRHKCRFGMDW